MKTAILAKQPISLERSIEIAPMKLVANFASDNKSTPGYRPVPKKDWTDNDILRKAVFGPDEWGWAAAYKKQAKQDDGKPNLPAAVALGAGAAHVGQQTIRSGLPRALGVRLESHSTSNKNAAEILKNDGWLDPNKSGTKATQGADIVLKDAPFTQAQKDEYIKATRNKVYITGLHPDRNTPIPANLGFHAGKLPSEVPLLDRLAYRKHQRMGYRAQGEMDWEKIKSSSNPQQALEEARLKGVAKAAWAPWHGRSLYVGGSDDYFKQNFKADFDDPFAQYAEEKVKVHGNRFAAAKAAIDREGLLNLMRANKGRVAAGIGILAAGGLTTAALGKAAIDAARGDGTVKGFKRKSKTGKVSMVRGFKRKSKA